MSENHTLECQGCQILRKCLTVAGRTVGPSKDRTFDLIVDGEYAEVKAKAHGWERFDFISLTQKQRQSLGNKLKKVFVVLNVSHPSEAEVWEIKADDLMKCKCHEIMHYEWNKGDIKHLRNHG